MIEGKIGFARSIGGKILLYTELLLLTVCCVMACYFWYEEYMTFLEGRKAHINGYVRAVALEIERINLETVTTVKVLALAQENGLFGRREESVRLARAVLENNPNLYDTYIIYEPDGDGQDASHRGGLHHDESGRFNAVWNRVEGELEYVHGVDMEKSLYYQGVKERWLSGAQERHMITEPYVYEGLMMVEHTYPIIVEGEFVGITGADRTLGALDRSLSQLKPYHTADFLLVTGSGGIVVATHDKALVTKRLGDTPYRELEDSFKSDQAGVITDPVKDEEYFFASATIPTGGWHLVMRVSAAEIFAPLLPHLLISLALALLGMGLVFLVLRFLVKRITVPIITTVGVAQSIAKGDLTTEISTFPTDETGLLLQAIRAMADNLGSLVGQTQLLGYKVNSLMAEIASSAQQLEVSTSMQANSMKKVQSNSTLISDTAQDLALAMDGVKDLANDVQGDATSSLEDLKRMTSAMASMRGATKTISKKFTEINDKASNIGEVITIINRVADQTNLLSLNASLEAEKAGEFGYGFAVVAKEMRRLSNQVVVAAQDIEEMVGQMLLSFSSGAMEVDRFSQEVKGNIAEVEEVSRKLASIAHEVQSIMPKVEVVHGAMREQSEAASQISLEMGQLSEGAVQTNQSLKEFKSSLDQLGQVSGTLRKELARFKVRAES